MSEFEMVERVANAIAIQLAFPEKPSLRTEHTHAAIAAIAAMREPTPEMIIAGRADLVAPIGRANAKRVSEHIWQAMIAEAMK